MSNTPTNTPTAEHDDDVDHQLLADTLEGIGHDPDLGLTGVLEINARLNATVDGAAGTDKVVEDPALTVEQLDKRGIQAKNGPQKSV